MAKSRERDDAWFGWAGPIPFTVWQRTPACKVSLGSIDGNIPQDIAQLKDVVHKVKAIKAEKHV